MVQVGDTKPHYGRRGVPEAAGRFASPDRVREEEASALTRLDVNLDRPLPDEVVVGFPTAVLCLGTCSHAGEPVRDLSLVASGHRYRPAASAMPRADSRLSGFWGAIPLDPAAPGRVEVGVEARLGDGSLATAPLGSIEIVSPPRVGLGERGLPDTPLIAICLATYNSDPGLFRVQVESIREQTDTDWICVVSDDCSESLRFDAIEEILDGDERFILTRSPRRLGFYRNFERLLALAPAEAQLIALADHDDRWHREKLASLRAALGDAELAFSDARLTDASGNVRSPTFWVGRRNNYENLASLLMANTVAGASCLMRRRVVERALPFPGGPGWDFHDHWLALVALSMGDLAYVDRPLYDYVQHPAAVLGRGASGAPAGEAQAGVSKRWRDMYFGAYLQRQLQARILLERCGGELTPRKRRALELTERATRSPVAFGWLALRPLRALLGRNETLGFEGFLLRGILWRHVISLRRRWKRPGVPFGDATPSADSKSLGSRQRRWLTGRR